MEGPAVGDLVHITLPNRLPSIYVVRHIDQSKVYVSTELKPDAISSLYFEGKWKVSGSDLDYEIKFVKEKPRPKIEKPFENSTPGKSQKYAEMLKILKQANILSYYVDNIYNDDGYIALNYDLSTDKGKFFTASVSYADLLDVDQLIAAFRPGFGNKLKDLLIKHLNEAIEGNYTAGVAYQP